MLSRKPLSKMDHTKKAEDMRHLIQPRGPGTGWVFRMITSPDLIGKLNPWTGKPFGKEIRRGLNIRHLPTARKQRDICLGEVRRLSFDKSDEGSFTIDQAEAWHEDIARDPSNQGAIGSVLQDRLEAASKRGVPECPPMNLSSSPLRKEIQDSPSGTVTSP